MHTTVTYVGKSLARLANRLTEVYHEHHSNSSSHSLRTFSLLSLARENWPPLKMMNEKRWKSLSAEKQQRWRQILVQIGWTDSLLLSSTLLLVLQTNLRKSENCCCTISRAAHTHTTANRQQRMLGQAVGVNGFPIGQFPLPHCKKK